MKRHNFFLPTDLVDQLKAIAIETGVPMSELVRRAIHSYLVERSTKAAA